MTFILLLYIIYYVLYRYPIYTAADLSDTTTVLQLKVHSTGPVVSTFTTTPVDNNGVQRLVTVGQQDGSIMVWDITA